ncbi:MAG: alpha/beta hydrolase [Sphaerochaetaceae bacterium]
MAAVFLLSGCVSDKMIARAVAKYFDSNEPTVLVDGYERIRAGVSAWVDVPYGDTSKSEILDVYRPMHTDAKLPLIIWVHGGAYIAGSKEQSVPYVVMLADKGFVTATINYQVAPKGKYPLPVEQTAKAYRYLMDNAEAYGIDTDLVFLAGDSAGAQIAAQFLVAQTSLDYAMKAGLPQVVDDPRTLRGALLFCGPYDITKFDSMGENTTLSRVMEAIARLYLGAKDWRNSEQARFASVIGFVTADFPPTFLTDGDSFSFLDHAEELDARLRSLGVESQLVAYPDAGLGHEYQFSMDLPQALETFDAVVSFAKRYGR